jgi:hypothetical protein
MTTIGLFISACVSFYGGASAALYAALQDTHWHTQRVAIYAHTSKREFDMCEGCAEWRALGGGLIQIALCLAGSGVLIGLFLLVMRRRG